MDDNDKNSNRQSKKPVDNRCAKTEGNFDSIKLAETGCMRSSYATNNKNTLSRALRNNIARRRVAKLKNHSEN